MQVTVPIHPSRFRHSATAFSLSPGLTEVTIFGGCLVISSLLLTSQLRLGESHLMCVSHTSHRSCDRDTTIASHDYVTMQACHDHSLHEVVLYQSCSVFFLFFFGKLEIFGFEGASV